MQLPRRDRSGAARRMADAGLAAPEPDPDLPMSSRLRQVFTEHEEQVAMLRQRLANTLTERDDARSKAVRMEGEWSEAIYLLGNVAAVLRDHPDPTLASVSQRVVQFLCAQPWPLPARSDPGPFDEPPALAMLIEPSPIYEQLAQRGGVGR